MGIPSVSWDAPFEGTPAGWDDPRACDDRIRELKTANRERLEREHGGATGEASDRHGVHRKGSSRASYATGDPTTVPDGTGTRVLNVTDDDGRLHVDSTSKLMRVYNGSSWEYPIADGGIHLKKINIGDWNMDTTLAVSIAHGLSILKIIGANALIRRDDDTMLLPIWYDNAGNGAAGRLYISTSNVELQRTTGYMFDSANYDSTSFNRGWILIWYVD